LTTAQQVQIEFIDPVRVFEQELRPLDYRVLRVGNAPDREVESTADQLIDQVYLRASTSQKPVIGLDVTDDLGLSEFVKRERDCPDDQLVVVGVEAIEQLLRVDVDLRRHSCLGMLSFDFTSLLRMAFVTWTNGCRELDLDLLSVEQTDENILLGKEVLHNDLVREVTAEREAAVEYDVPVANDRNVHRTAPDVHKQPGLAVHQIDPGAQQSDTSLCNSHDAVFRDAVAVDLAIFGVQIVLAAGEIQVREGGFLSRGHEARLNSPTHDLGMHPFSVTRNREDHELRLVQFRRSLFPVMVGQELRQHGVEQGDHDVSVHHAARIDASNHFQVLRRAADPVVCRVPERDDLVVFFSDEGIRAERRAQVEQVRSVVLIARRGSLHLLEFRRPIQRRFTGSHVDAVLPRIEPFLVEAEQCFRGSIIRTERRDAYIAAHDFSSSTSGFVSGC